jgi:hypothetical protein
MQLTFLELFLYYCWWVLYFVGYFIMLYVSRIHIGFVNNGNLEEIICGLIYVLSRYLPLGSEDNHEESQSVQLVSQQRFGPSTSIMRD